MMKKTIALLVMIWLTTMTVKGQTYAALWKQAQTARQSDLPKTEYEVLMKIVAKAQKEGELGQLMKAELQGAQVVSGISPDSLLPAVERMEARGAACADEAQRAVYQTVVWRICRDNPSLEKSAEKAQLTPALCQRLAAVKAAAYEPLTVKGADSRWFDDDLLSVIGYEQKDFQPLHDYYVQAGNRRAALMTALEALKEQRPAGHYKLAEAAYLQRLDSLIAAYGDLEEAGEVAICRYDYMQQHTDATPEQLWRYAEEALGRWGQYARMNELRNAQRTLTATGFRAHAESYVAVPQQTQPLQLADLRGISELTVRFYQVKSQGDAQLHPESTEGYRKLKPLLTPMPELTQTRHYTGHEAYELFTDSLTLPALPVGIYMVEMESKPASSISRKMYYVSNVRLLTEALPNNQLRYVVVDATTGQPVKEAKIALSFYNQGKETKETLTTDGKGEALYQYKSQRPRDAFVYTAQDKACPSASVYNNFSYYDNNRQAEHTQLYTDRALYRPGQTVHVAAIAYETIEGYRHKALEGRKLTLALRDANGKVISEQQVETDSYGTCAADFTLPIGGLTGYFTVGTGNGSCSFRVEEYKRPTFQVELPPVEQAYADGDMLTVKGTAKTYAGVPVQGGKVKYTVVRRPAWWWVGSFRGGGMIGQSPVETVCEGETLTDGNGGFAFDTPLVLPPADNPMPYRFYNFVCTAEVTDLAGETHQAQLSLPLGNRAQAFGCDLPDQVLAEKMPNVVFSLRNVAGTDIEGTVKYRLDEGKWQTVKANSPLAISQKPMKSGLHTLEAICGQDTLKQKFTVFSLEDKRPAAETDDWFYVSDSQFPNDGSPVTVQVGSSAKDVHIVYSIISGNRVLESGAVDKSNELINRKFTYQDDYGTGLQLTFAWVKQGKVYRHATFIQRPLPDKQLTLSWKTFRDRLEPGQQEEWVLEVAKPDGTPADAQLMAVLYDKSLDQLAGHDWSFSPYMHLPRPSAYWQSPLWGWLSLNGHHAQKMLTVNSLQYTHFDDEIFPLRWGGVSLLRSAKMAARGAMKMDAGNAMMQYDGIETAAVTDLSGRIAGLNLQVEEAADESGQNEAAETTEASVSVRENLQETAFFYPQLTADSEGRVVLKFTLPESLTTWRLMGLAHTADLSYGLLRGEVVAKKDVMIQPNVPRFLREGDEAVLSARIFNTGEQSVVGVACLQLTDPETGAVVSEQRKEVAVEAGATGSVAFSFAPDSGTPSLLIARVTVSGQGFSDGEQHYLPILPNRERVTVTVPFTQNGPGTKTVDLTTLFPQADQNSAQQQPKLTVEYTNNPAWLMIQTLPTVGHPNDDCSLCQAVALYANTIGSHIIDQNPQARQMFELWKRETGSETSLQSALEKNQELRDVVLAETPWVADAEAETEQKQRLADFFDTNLMQQRLSAAAEKLGKMQQADGSWPWWPGMGGSLSMTASVSETLAKLKHLTGKTQQEMLDKAMKYMGKEMVKLVAEMKKEEQKGHRQTFPSRTALQWLYICKLDGRQLPADVQRANSYLTGLLKKQTKQQTIYEKALSAMILESAAYAKSLKEFTVYREDMGRYYDTPRAEYSWRDYRIPTQVAAIAALQQLTPNDTLTISEMQRWLLQQKRTQSWDTPLNAVDAIYAFLNGQSRQLEAQPQTALAVDNRPLSLPKATAGLGYVKTAQPYAGERQLTAEKTSAGTSWGAVYAQFMQPVSDIADNGSGLTVKREILGGQQLRVGDKVKVRITIQAERDLDFVCVQDKRAACMEPVRQLSGYANGYYCTSRDNTTSYYFDVLRKGRHVIETEYYIDRVGHYQTGTCTAQCAYAPEFRATAHSAAINVED